jgi:hypothetical protein
MRCRVGISDGSFCNDWAISGPVMRGDPDVAATCGVPGTCVVGEAERPRKSNGLRRWMARTRKRLTMAPTARSTTRRVTRSSAASALAKKKGGTEGAAVAKMPPKKGRKTPVKGATKERFPKGNDVARWTREERIRGRGVAQIAVSSGGMGRSATDVTTCVVHIIVPIRLSAILVIRRQ